MSKNITFLDNRFKSLGPTLVSLVVRGFYDDKSPCLGLVDAETGEPWATCTVRMERPPREGYVFIKDWSEGEGMPQLLTANSVIKPLPCGFFNGVGEYKLTEAILLSINEKRVKDAA